MFSAEPKPATIHSIADHESGYIETPCEVILDDDPSPLRGRDLLHRESASLDSSSVLLELRRQSIRRDQDQGTEFVRLTVVDRSLLLGDAKNRGLPRFDRVEFELGDDSAVDEDVRQLVGKYVAVVVRPRFLNILSTEMSWRFLET
jgi:hypothetical protein